MPPSDIISAPFWLLEYFLKASCKQFWWDGAALPNTFFSCYFIVSVWTLAVAVPFSYISSNILQKTSSAPYQRIVSNTSVLLCFPSVHAFECSFFCCAVRYISTSFTLVWGCLFEMYESQKNWDSITSTISFLLYDTSPSGFFITCICDFSLFQLSV